MGMKLVRPSTESEKKTNTTMTTVEITEPLVATWRLPWFQRELQSNAKMKRAVAVILGSGGVIPGVITLGVIDGVTYLVDGQHRLHLWRMSGLPVGYADVRTHWFADMDAAAREFELLNGHLARMRPDDMLRSNECGSVALQRLRKKCPFIGYDMIRRGSSEKAPMLSMAVFLRAWMAARAEVPTWCSAQDALGQMDETETTNAIAFATHCYEAWHRDREYVRLWGSLNLALCAWLYRRLVHREKVAAVSPVARFTEADFRRCLTGLSAETSYLDYLHGRTLTDPHRAPAYARVKRSFQRRYLAEHGKAIKLPAPAWAHQ